MIIRLESFIVQFCLFVIAMLFSNVLLAQESTDTTKQIIIENADLQEIILEEDPPIQKLIGNVRAFHEGAYFYCDSAIIVGKNLKAYGDVIIIQNDTTIIFGEFLDYRGESKTAQISNKVILENGKDTIYTNELNYDLNKKVATYYKKAVLINGQTTTKSQSGSYDLESKVANFYKNVSVEGPDFKLLNDSLEYNLDTKISYWSTPTIIDKGKGKIYSESGFYNQETGEAEFNTNASYTDDESTAKADTIKLLKGGDLMYLIGDAVYTTKTDTAIGDKILFDKLTEISTIEGNAVYISPDNKAEGDIIIYDKKNDNIKLNGPSTVSDPPILISGLNIDYDKKNKGGIVVGDVVWKDTSAQIEIQCDSLIYTGENESAKAIGFNQKPLLLSYATEDTLYISADTLLKIRQISIPDTNGVSDTINFLIGDNKAKVYSDDYQATSDSLAYNLTDSLISLLNKPLLWQDTTQMKGDTINIQIKNKKISSMHIAQNGFIINSPDLIFFNQIKGRVIDVDFEKGEMKKMKVNGNAESIYYMLDDENAYIGVNESKCSLMIFTLENGKIISIGSYTTPEATLHPMKNTNHESIKLDGYKWDLSRRPLGPELLRILE